MEFLPAGNILGPQHPVREITLHHGPGLPDGDYAFLDSYCSDPDCDCRKVMIQVHYNRRYVALINYGWESIAFYKSWYGATKIDLQTVQEMKGPSIDLNSPNRLDPQAILALFQHLLDERFRQHFANSYTAFKAALATRGEHR